MPFKPAIKKLDLYGIVDVGSTDPASGTQGQLFYNSTDSALKIYYNSAWVSIGTSTAGGTFDFIDGSEFEFIDGSFFDFIT